MASTNRRSFLARSAALAAIPAVATLAGGPAVNAQGFYVGQVEKNLYWVTDATYHASAPVIKKYLGVLAAADVYTASTAFVILESIRLDLGVGSQVHA